MEILKFKGKVIHGNGDGTKLKLPTANLEVDQSIIQQISLGVYASIIKVDRKYYKSITHIGPRAVFKENHIQIEVHIFDFKRFIYDLEVELKLMYFIRPTQKFDDLDDMMEQIKEDIKKAKELLQAYQL